MFYLLQYYCLQSSAINCDCEIVWKVLWLKCISMLQIWCLLVKRKLWRMLCGMNAFINTTARILKTRTKKLTDVKKLSIILIYHLWNQRPKLISQHKTSVLPLPQASKEKKYVCLQQEFLFRLPALFFLNIFYHNCACAFDISAVTEICVHLLLRLSVNACDLQSFAIIIMESRHYPNPWPSVEYWYKD